MGERIAAAVIDSVVNVVFVFVVLVVLGRLGVGGLAGWLLLLVAGLGYYAGPEARWGQTPGKHAMGLVVTDRHGGQATTGQVVARTLFRPVDGLFYWLVGLVAMLVSERNQRVGDRVAGTVVLEAANRQSGRDDPRRRRADRRSRGGRRH